MTIARRMGLKEGSYLIYLEDDNRSLTMYERYKIEHIQFHEDDVDIIIRDDYGSRRGVSLRELQFRKFIAMDSPEHKRLEAFIDLVVGDQVECEKSFKSIKPGDILEVMSLHGGEGIIVRDKYGEDTGILNRAFIRHFIVSDQSEARHIKDEDYSSMIDVAIDTGDKAWFKELVEKVTGIIEL